MAQLITIMLVFIILAGLRFGVPILGMWLINKGCCLLEAIRV